MTEGLIITFADLMTSSVSLDTHVTPNQTQHQPLDSSWIILKYKDRTIQLPVLCPEEQ